jgi:signal transduction histidine kinase
LRATIEDVVRPVSHDLDRQVADIGGDAPVTRDDRILWPRVLANSTLGQPIRPLIFSIWSGISALFFAPRLWGFWEGVTVAATVFAVPFLLLVVIRGFWARVASHRSSLARAAIFTGSLLMLGLISASTAGFTSGLSERFVPMIIPQTMLWTLSGWVVAILPSLREETVRVLRELNAATSELREELVRLNTAYRLQQKAIARALHGPIQDAMSVSSFRLAAAVESGTATPELIVELRDMIGQTLVLLEKADDEVPNLDGALADVAELWEGVVEITWTINPDAAQVIRDHQITAASATELVREAVSNSVRHGQASEVAILVSLEGDRLLLRVENNGAFESERKKKKGLGTTLLDELALSWSRVRENSKTVLTATLPVI